MMRVADLIEQLSKLPPDARVGFGGEMPLPEHEYKFNIGCYGCVPFYVDDAEIKVEGKQVSIILDFHGNIPF